MKKDHKRVWDHPVTTNTLGNQIGNRADHRIRADEGERAKGFNLSSLSLINNKEVCRRVKTIRRHHGCLSAGGVVVWTHREEVLQAALTGPQGTVRRNQDVR
ncbi:MAG: hypothetical protein P8Z33_14595, partial [Gammaproteobacteria bacterium]